MKSMGIRNEKEYERKIDQEYDGEGSELKNWEEMEDRRKDKRKEDILCIQRYITYK